MLRGSIRPGPVPVNPSPPGAHARRSPLQARSRARVDLLLDAADAVFLEMGYAAATTNHVAARANMSIGSLYRFFPNKEALLVALAERYGAALREIAATVTPPAPGKATLAALVSTGIQTFHDFLVAHPGFSTIVAEHRNPALRAGAAAHDASMGALIDTLTAQIAPHLDDTTRATVVEVTLTVLGSLQLLALSAPESRRAMVVAEAQMLVTGYLSRRLGVPEDQPLG